MKYNNQKTSKNLFNKYIASVKKLACGKSTVIPNYGKITAYRNSKGIRKFSLSGSTDVPNGGNLSIKVIESDLDWIFN